MLTKFIFLFGALKAALAFPINSFPGANSTDSSLHHKNSARGPGGVVVFGNQCYYDVWIWSMSSGFSTPPIKIEARTQYTENKRAPAAGGVAFKVSLTNQLLAGRHTQFEYSISNNILYYDISLVDCAQDKNGANCPGWDTGLQIMGQVGACPTVTCSGNSYCPNQAYFVDTPVQKLGIPEPVYQCGETGPGVDLYFQTCSDNSPVS